MAPDPTQGTSGKVEARAASAGDGTLGNGSVGRGNVPARDGQQDVDPVETREWLDALDSVLQTSGPERAQFLLRQLKNRAVRSGVVIPFTANTPYINTIPTSRQPIYP